MKKEKKKNQNTKQFKIKKFNIYITIVTLLMSWLAITNFLLLCKYDILPIKFLIPVTIALLGIPATLIFFMFRKKTKIKFKGILSGISIFLSILFIIILIYLNKTFSFLNKLSDTGYKTENYSVIVLKDSNYNNIEDINNKTISYYKNETSNIEQALTKLDETIDFTKKSEEDYTKLVESLYNNQTEAIVIEESYRGIIEETDETFSDKTKTIYTIEIETETIDITKNVNVNKETFNIYISGIDTYGKISSVSRSDVNIIATVNPKTHQILLTTIPRDYYVQLDGTTGYKDKLTHAGIYGVEKSIKTLENLLDIEINYYIKVNFSSLEKLIDALGGVDVYSEYTFTGTAGSSFKKGYNRVNGVQALEFARTRKTVSGGDRTRGKNQQALIQAMISKACSKEIITKYTSILNSLEGSFQTNMSTDKMTDIIKKQIDEMKPWNVTSVSLDGAGSSEFTHSYNHQKLYVMIPDETTIENAKNLIEKVSNDEILEGSYNIDKTSVNDPIKEKPKPEEKTEEVKEEPTNNELTETPKKEEIKEPETNQEKEEPENNDSEIENNTNNNAPSETPEKEEITTPEKEEITEPEKEETPVPETPKEEPKPEEKTEEVKEEPKEETTTSESE